MEGALNATGMRFAIAVSRFNSFITERLLLSAIRRPSALGRKEGKDRSGPRPRRVRNSSRRSQTRRDEKIRRHHLHWLSSPWRHRPLRRDRQRGHARHWPVRAGNWCPARFRSAHLRHARTSHRPCRTKNGQQGIRSRARGNRDGEFGAAVRRPASGAGAGTIKEQIPRSARNNKEVRIGIATSVEDEAQIISPYSKLTTGSRPLTTASHGYPPQIPRTSPADAFPGRHGQANRRPRSPNFLGRTRHCQRRSPRFRRRSIPRSHRSRRRNRPTDRAPRRTLAHGSHGRRGSQSAARRASPNSSHIPETPRAVVINEALEIARKFSSPESVQFVNGVLDSVGKELQKPA